MMGTLLWLAGASAQNNDCINAEIICSDDNIGTNPLGPGLNDFADPDNFDGCLSGENQSGWYYFEIQPTAPPGLELGFIINPDAGAGQDYDFAVFGPNVECDDLGSPIRCSYAGGSCALCPQTGLGMGATDFSESPGGNGFVATLTVNPGEGYYLLIDNFSNNSTGFSMTWTGSAAPFLNCIECDADAGMVSANTSPACPGDIINYTVTGYWNDPAYTQLVLIADDNGDIVDIVAGDAGSLTSPDCATFTIYSYNYETAGGSFVPSIGDNVSSIDCSVECCDLAPLNVSFEDNELPTFPNAPGDITLSCEDGIPPLTDQQWQDNCDGSGFVSGTETGGTDPCNGGTITREWQYVDVCDNTGMHVQTITIEPTDEAMFINPPADINVSCDAVPTGPGADLAYTNNLTGSCEIAGMTSPVRAGSADVCGGTITYTWQATDPCGRMITHVQTITVDPAPEASFQNLPADFTINCSDVATLTAPNLNYTNNAAGGCEITGSVAPVQSGSADECGGTITFTWNFTDPCGRSINHVQNVTVEPAPQASFLSFPADFTVTCAAFDGTPPADLAYTNNELGICEISGTVAAQESGMITECGGSIDYTWEFTDNCGRTITHVQTVTVTPAPIAQFINPPGDITVTCENIPDGNNLELTVDNGFAGSCEIFAIVAPSITGNADLCGGTLVYTWEFTDDCGRTSTHVQNINVEPAESPAFIDPPGDMTISCSEIPSGASLTLFYSNNASAACQQLGFASPFSFGVVDECGGFITNQWSFTDDCGEVISHTQTLTVLPVPDPVFINLPTDGSLSCGSNFADPPELEYSNGETGDCAIEGTVVASVTNLSATEVQYDWSFTSPCSGNVISYSQTVVIEEAPDISLMPDQATICNGEDFDLATVSVTDQNTTNPDITYHTGTPATTMNQITDLVVSPADTTFYFVLATNADGCSDEAPFTLNVDPVPNAGVGTIDTICFELADGIDLFSYISGTTDQSGQWVDTDGSGVNLSVPGNVNLTVAPPGTYDFLYIVNSLGVCPNDTATVTLELLAPISIDIADLTCSDDLNFYSIDLSGNGFIITSIGGGLLTDLGGDQYTISDIPIANTVTITASNPIAVGCEQNFTVNPPDCDCPNVTPPVNDGPLEICVGDPNPELSVTVGAGETANWYTTPTGGMPFLVASTTYTPTETMPGRYEYYTETEIIADSCTSALRTLVIFDINDVPTGMDAMLVTCDTNDDGLAPFTLSDADTLINSAPGLTFTYFESLTAAQMGSPALPDNFVNTTPGSQDLFALITNDDGCTAIVTVTLMVNLPPDISLDLTGESCPGAADGVAVVGAPAGATFSLDSMVWTTNNTFPNLPPGDYTVYVESDAGCIATEDFTIIPGLEIIFDTFEANCRNNGTSSDPSDDDYEVTFTLSNSLGSAGTYTVNDGTIDWGSFAYGSPVTQIIPANDQSLLLTFTDDSRSCTVTRSLGPLPTCSPDCLISIDQLEFVCNDNVTPTNPDDDFYTITISTSALNGSAGGTYDVLVDGIVNNTFNYGEVSTFSLPADGGSPLITVTDSDESTCTDDQTIGPLANCSPDCNLGLTIFFPVCDDAGTNTDPSDDVYFFDAVVTGVNVSDSWTWEETGFVGNYGDTLTFGPYPISGGDLVFTVSDLINTTCPLSLDVTAPATCSDVCEINITDLDVFCNDNGTTSIQSDDFYTVTVNADVVNGGGTGNFTVFVDGIPFAVFAYGTGGEITLPADGSTPLFEVADEGEGTCSVAQSIGTLDPCNGPCSITGMVSDIICDDAGTNNPDDDTFTFTLTVEGENTSMGWLIAGDPTINAFSTTLTMGPYLITDGDLLLDISDAENPACGVQIPVSAPPSCSPVCMISSVVSNIQCNDEGTNDPSDDTFTFTAVISGMNNATSWTATDGTIGTYGVATTFGPYPISGGDQVIDVEDDDNLGCITQLTAPAPATCSPTCAIAITALNLVCNDNGTVSIQSDDFYELTINAAATAGGDDNTFVVLLDDVATATFTYGIGGTLILPADGAAPTVTVMDEQETDCTATDTIGPLEPCTDACTIQATVTNVRCNDQGTGNDSSDDTFTFELTVSGQNTAGQWQSTDGTLGGVFGQTITVGPFLISDGNLGLILTDIENPDCLTQFTVMAPAACSFCRQTITTGPGATITCAEPTAPLVATSSAPGSYAWTLNGNVVSTELNTATTEPGTYVFTATYPNGCVAVDSIIIESTTDIPEITQIEIIPERCAGENNGRIIIEEITGGQSPFDYSLNGQSVNSAGFFTRLPPGDYNIVITDANGCQTDTLINIAPGPDLKITEPLFLSVMQGDSGMISVDVSVPTDELASIQWTPPNQLSCDTCLTTRYIAENSQNYILEVVHENGCIISTSLQLLALRGVEVFAPNVFSPNEDGTNDRFTLFTNDRVVEIESMDIFDRWGENVFRGNNFPPNEPEFGWDGRHDGNLMNPQVLVFSVVVILDDGTKQVFKGDFVLMR